MYFKFIQVPKVILIKIGKIQPPDLLVLLPSLAFTLGPKGASCVFYATRRQVYGGLTHNVFFYWSSDLIPHTQTHKAHSGASRPIHP